MLGWIIAAFVAWVLLITWCLCKAAAIGDKQIEEAFKAKRKDDTIESGKEVSAGDTKT